MEKELKTELEGMQTALEQKTEKSIDAKIIPLQTAINELKEAKPPVTAEQFKEVADKINVTVDGFDKYQKEQSKKKPSRFGGEVKSFNEYLAEGIEANKEQIQTLKKTKGKASFSFDVDEKVVNDMTFAANFPTADATVAFVRPGIIAPPPRKLHIRDLLVGGNMGAKSTFDYVKETSVEGSIAPVAEGALKPQIELNLQEFSVRAEWIAGWLRISRNMLDDITGMTTYLQSRLPELLLRAEDAQLISGNGTSPNLSGITDTGNFTAPTGSYTIDIEQLVGAIGQLEGYDRQADRILINPQDYYRLWLNKAAGSGEYDNPSLVTVVGGQMYIGGVPVYRSNAIATDKFIVGDWAMGANLIMREAPRVEFFFEDGINVRENMVTVRVEERVAFPIYGDNYFIYGDFGNS